MAELIGICIAFLGIWGSLWYKLGSLTKEVQHHNIMLKEISKTIEHILTQGGIKHG
jgi:hypothetical protein